MILQTPSASSKKLATPVKPAAAASPNKKKPVSPVTPVTAAPSESSETTDISENEENTPAVVRDFYQYLQFLLYFSLWHIKTNHPRRHLGYCYGFFFLQITKEHFVWLFPYIQASTSELTPVKQQKSTQASVKVCPMIVFTFYPHFDVLFSPCCRLKYE